jgi:hypothetical protein
MILDPLGAIIKILLPFIASRIQRSLYKLSKLMVIYLILFPVNLDITNGFKCFLIVAHKFF